MSTTPTIEAGPSQPLPVLRVRYADGAGTWLYIDPHRGSIALRSQRHNRVRRWLYNGLHKFDFPFLYGHRLLWQLAIVFMSIGGLVLSTTTLLPMYRRLRRHASRAIRLLDAPWFPTYVKSPEFGTRQDQRVGGDRRLTP